MISVTELTDNISLFVHQHAKILEDLVYGHNVLLYIHDIIHACRGLKFLSMGVQNTPHNFQHNPSSKPQ